VTAAGQDLRFQGAFKRGHQVEIVVDGERLVAFEGETLATSLWASGKKQFRRTPRSSPRGVFCGMGICYDCVMTVDGVPNTRACMTPVRDGMRVETQG
jgi:predicted molibdopterin-dependent oxidoreductase YjgC